ncbi:hypothetical protein [Nocardioides euryhalodurans]|uniref:Uncharacterized protein n=1 Tax=Nocardioides euryhalodurans TaxID=2518370 RepID=A0A4P7GJU2_9ACTN|nr:hypothetical protein [Nocardioides euryhalodurans]QBR92024.1 hypothetical protein EXE57_06835 [Nocardioides euryhalodurans]
MTGPFALLALFTLDGFGTDASVLGALGYGLICLALPVVALLLTQWLAPRLFGWALACYVAGVVTGLVVLGVLA